MSSLVSLLYFYFDYNYCYFGVYRCLGLSVVGPEGLVGPQQGLSY